MGNKKKIIQFRGESKLASDREFFLWFDANSQKMVLERCGIQIKQLKHDREQTKISTNYSDTSKDRMKQLTQKHKLKKLKKLKRDKKEKEKDAKLTKRIKSKLSISSNNNKYETSSTHSTSQS